MKQGDVLRIYEFGAPWVGELISKELKDGREVLLFSSKCVPQTLQLRRPVNDFENSLCEANKNLDLPGENWVVCDDEV
ncbi:hypothetical protein BSZ19_20390 [Bradyrhizobium japonicum]|uniref:Uncharacterized protein n=2 Tax=Bradyrhizobium japonicum TaxID=375 RepID=A0A1Y2JMR5_BRAJP|nr:hypothetical protein BSZ19_20390 [Bradyrhizobium japonicum]